MRRKNPDHLEDQCRSWLARRKEQPITDDLIKDFCLYLWKNKKKSDLSLMKDMVVGKEAFTMRKYRMGTL